jgi:hypothetical protein
MGKMVVASSRGAALAPEQDSPTPEEIQRQLQNILASPAFHGSKRCHQFLQYVCEKSLSGEAGTLKERTIAIEVFGRNPQSDLGEDTIVRVGAREVRKRLAQYYVTPEGAASEILIDLLPGSYVPEFRHVSAHKVKDPQPVLIADGRRRPLWRLSAIFAGGFVLLAALVGLTIAKWPGSNPNAEAFNRFWEPALRAPEPLLVAVAHPIVYHPSRRASALSAENAPQTGIPVQRPIQLPPNTALDGSDLVPVRNQYVGFGDMVAATEVSAMLARRSKAVRVRLASSIEFADLRKAQTLLIGAITNRWTMELQPAWRFQFSQASGLRTVITDTSPDSRREWSIPANDDGSAPEDYILVCRIRNSVTGGLQLVTAGLKQFGTEAGGRLLADQDQLGVILRKIPAGWETKNLQIVLHAKVIGNTPAQPEVVAWHVW